MSKKPGWIGVDWDRTMVEYHTNPQGYNALEHGAFLWPMVQRVKNWLAEGREVRIFTARASGFDLSTEEGRAGLAAVVASIQAKLGEAGIQPLDVTCEKDYKCDQIWDDIAVSMRPNTGTPVFIP